MNRFKATNSFGCKRMRWIKTKEKEENPKKIEAKKNRRHIYFWIMNLRSVTHWHGQHHKQYVYIYICCDCDVWWILYVFENEWNIFLLFFYCLLSLHDNHITLFFFFDHTIHRSFLCVFYCCCCWSKSGQSNTLDLSSDWLFYHIYFVFLFVLIFIIILVLKYLFECEDRWFGIENS